MKLLFLGTGAGETWPAPFCRCRACRQARRAGNVLGCASVLVDRQYLFDAPSGLGMNLALLKVELKFPFHIFISHSHQDHFDPQEIYSARAQCNRAITLYLNRTAAGLLRHYARFNRFRDFSKLPDYQVRVVQPFRPVGVDDRAAVIPILAEHDRTKGEQPLNFILKIGAKSVLYACDTGWYDARSWAAVACHRFAAVILECSCLRTKTGGRNHLDFEYFGKFVAKLRQTGSITPRTQVLATHFGLHDYDARQARALQRQGIVIARRGLECVC